MEEAAGGARGIPRPRPVRGRGVAVTSVGRARRAGRIVGLAVRMLLELIWLERQRPRQDPEAFAIRQERVLRAQAVRLRETAVELQGLLIKLGQFLSTRVDVLPESFTHELAALRDAVPPVPWPAVRAQIEDDLGASLGSVFPSFDPSPVASASLGQVHRATLPDGRQVAVKVRRPGIAALVEVDLQAVRTVVRWASRLDAVRRRVDLVALYRELERTTREELDYVLEAEHARRFAANFSGQTDVVVPAILPEHGGRRLLVMEFVVGTRLDDRTALLASGVDPAVMAERMVRTYLQQVLRDGFFHADPHPGNVFADEQGRLIYVDFGMMGELSARDRSIFGGFVSAVIRRDFEALAQAVTDLGFLRPHADREALKKGLAVALDHLSGLPPQGPSGEAFEDFLEEMRDFIRSEPFQLPYQYAFLGRAAGILLGLCSELDPGVDYVRLLRANALPYLDLEGQGGEPAAEAQSGPGGIPWSTVRREALRLGTSLYRLPGRLERILEKAESGDLRVRVELGAIGRRLEERTQATDRLTRGVLAAAAAGAATAFTLAGRLWPLRLAWIAAGLLAWTALRGSRR